MDHWPDNLVNEVARRRVVLFLGSGVSSSSIAEDSTRPVSWVDFLAGGVGLLPNHELKQNVEKLISSKKYLLALQAIKDNADTGDYHNYLNNCFNEPKFKASPLHNELLNLDIPISVTTNFDKIYDNFCEGTSSEAYKVVSYHSNDLADLIRSDCRLIIKAHGSINEIGKMIFTRSEYHHAKKSYPQFYEILKALFLTQTVIFIGCGMEDPDILLTLEDVKITGSNLKPHYALSRKGQIDDLHKKELLTAYNIRVLEYGNEHDDLTPYIQDLYEQVEAVRNPVF